MNLKDKVVLITGSSIGIGAATAKEFAKEGSKLVITYNSNKEEAEKVEKECQKLGAAGSIVTKLDITRDEDIRRTVAETLEKFGAIDILINNAGVFAEGSVLTTTFEDIAYQVRVNVEGLIKITHEALPYVKEAIINISSRAGFKAYPGYATYGTTKWAVRGFSKSLAAEIDIPVYCVNPAGTATQMNDWEGVPPEKVAQVIIDTLKGKIKAQSGDDVNVWEY